MFAALLPDSGLRPALLQGLAMGLGGLDAQLASAAAAALTGALAACADLDGGGRLGADSLLRAVLDDLPALWQRTERWKLPCLI